MTAVTGDGVLLLRQANEIVVLLIAQLDVDTKQLGGNLRTFAQNDGAFYGVL
ncbi:hypothetical protein D3C73_1465920 [compost metagenome]